MVHFYSVTPRPLTYTLGKWNHLRILHVKIYCKFWSLFDVFRYCLSDSPCDFLWFWGDAVNQPARWPLAPPDIPMAEWLRLWLGEQRVGWPRIRNPAGLLIGAGTLQSEQPVDNVRLDAPAQWSSVDGMNYSTPHVYHTMPTWAVRGSSMFRAGQKLVKPHAGVA